MTSGNTTPANPPTATWNRSPKLETMTQRQNHTKNHIRTTTAVPATHTTATWNHSHSLKTTTYSQIRPPLQTKTRTIAVHRKSHTSRFDCMLPLRASTTGCIEDHGSIRCHISSTYTTSNEYEKKKTLRHRRALPNVSNSTSTTHCLLYMNKKWARESSHVLLAQNANKMKETKAKNMLSGTWHCSDWRNARAQDTAAR